MRGLSWNLMKFIYFVRAAFCRNLTHKSVSPACGLGMVLFWSGIALAPAAPTSSWTGTTSTNWSVAADWDTLPANGSNLVFGATIAPRVQPNNNTSGSFPLTSVASITFVAGPGSQSFRIGGSGFALGAGASTDVTLLNNNVSGETIALTSTMTLSPATYATQIWDLRRLMMRD
jgi:hypothetical protein